MNCDDKKLPAIVGRFGGKSRLKKEIVDNYFIKDYQNKIYVEPFVGGGSIFFYKDKSKEEIINDIDNNIIIIYKGVKKYNSDKIENIVNNKYTKNEFEIIKNYKPKNNFERFIKTFILFRTSFYAQLKSYSSGRKNINKNLDCYKERMKKVKIYNKDYKYIIDKFDSADTFFYLDPPYEKSEGLYENFNLPIKDLFNILDNIKGKFLLSYNYSEEAIKLFKNYNIKIVETFYQNFETSKIKKADRIVKELLIYNYNI